MGRKIVMRLLQLQQKFYNTHSATRSQHKQVQYHAMLTCKVLNSKAKEEQQLKNQLRDLFVLQKQTKEQKEAARTSEHWDGFHQRKAEVLEIGKLSYLFNDLGNAIDQVKLQLSNLQSSKHGVEESYLDSHKNMVTKSPILVVTYQIMLFLIENQFSNIKHLILRLLLFSCAYSRNYKNHALDQFLEECISFTKNIVRVGGRSQNEALDAYNLNSKMHESLTRDDRYMYSTIQKSIAEKMDELKSLIDDMKRLSSKKQKVLTPAIFKSFTTEAQQQDFGEISKKSLREWLSESVWEEEEEEHLPTSTLMDI